MVFLVCFYIICAYLLFFALFRSRSDGGIKRKDCGFNRYCMLWYYANIMIVSCPLSYITFIIKYESNSVAPLAGNTG